MHKQNIADFILYEMNKKYIQNNFNVSANLISEIVDGWNREIYVMPHTQARFHHKQKSVNLTIN